MLPIDGPFEKTIYLTGMSFGQTNPGTMINYSNQWFRSRRVWYRQRKPYNIPLQFTYNWDKVTAYSAFGYDGPRSQSVYWSSGANPGSTSDTNDPSYSKAWSAFNGAVSNTANLALAVHERKQSLQMFEKRVLQLASFANALRKGDLLGAARKLGVKLPPKQLRKMKARYPKRVRKTPGMPVATAREKAFADNFLEFHFGWAPLVGDMQSAMEVLDTTPPIRPTRVRRGGTRRTFSEVTTTSGNTVTKTTTTVDYSTSFELSGLVRMTNSDAALAGNMGLLNPLTLVYEAVPFSFVLNWFVNVEEYLQGFTGLVGYSIENPCITFFGKSITQYNRWNQYLAQAPYGAYATIERIALMRVPGAIPRPQLSFRPIEGLSATRGITAIALLLQRLRP